MKMIKNILFEVLPIGSCFFHLFDNLWMPRQKIVALLSQTSHLAIFVHLRKKWSAAEQVRVSSMQINGNRTEPSLVSKLYAKVFPNQMPQSFPWPVLLCGGALSWSKITLCCLFWYSGRFSHKAWFKLIICVVAQYYSYMS